MKSFKNMNEINMNTVLIILGVILVGWFLYSWLSVRNIEEPTYSVLNTAEGYEIREYDSYIIAETTIEGAKDRSDAATKGFPIIAGYIFGDNISENKIAMTAPVNTEEADSEKIAMTVPVNTEEYEGDGVYKISFVMPSKYTLDTLPRPNDSRVLIREVSSYKVAVRRFTWLAKEAAVKKQEGLLLSALGRDNIETMGEINIARYNPPWTIPFMLRNEVQVKIK